MDIKRKIDINVKKTVENSVANHDDFHFYIDELTENNYMPSYVGMAEEKYTFDEMDDDFFTFLENKAEDGIYIRLVFASSIEAATDEVIFKLEYEDNCEIFKSNEADEMLVFEFADFGIKVRGDEITFGATIEGGCGQTPYFAEFNSSKANKQFISLENPLNKHIISIMENMIIRG